MVRMRVLTWFLAGATLVACSGGDDAADGASAPATVPSSTVPPTTLAPEPTPTTTEPEVPAGVTMSVSSAAIGVSARLSGVAGATADPFGDFAMCSGQADRIGAYAVGVGDADGSVRWLSALTIGRVEGPGGYEADLRVELGSGEEVAATGTLTLDAGLASGSYLGFTADGDQVAGEFECERPGDALTSPPTDDLVEVVALLRQGTAERVVTAASDDPAVAECPGAAGGEIVAAIDGEAPATGALARFVLLETGDGASLDVLAGSTSYAFSGADLTIAGDRFRAAPSRRPMATGLDRRRLQLHARAVTRCVQPSQAGRDDS